MRACERRRWLAYEIQRLLAAGRSQREIARTLQISRKTVRRLLRDQERRRQQGEPALTRIVGTPRVPKGSMLDAYGDRIRGWLEDYPNLTAVRCREKLRAEGFAGGYTIVRELLRRLRAEVKPSRADVVVETHPGQRVEFDWTEYTLAEGLEVHLWNATLPWSGACHLAGATNQRQTTVLANLQKSFEFIRGVPAEVLTDSMPGVVDRWECDEPVLNIRFLDFAAYYRTAAVIAPRACPQWKARCERRHRHHEQNLLNGRTIRTMEEYRALLEWWVQEHVLARPHPTTGRPIGQMLDEERPYLKPLPAHPYDTRDVVVRLVGPTGHVHYMTNEYAMPDGHVGRRVYVCVDEHRVEICDPRARSLIEHERLPDGAGIRMAQIGSVRHRARYDLDALVERLAEWHEAAERFARHVVEARRYAGPELVRLLNLELEWSRDDVVAAIQHALEYGCGDSAAVRRILEARFTPRRFEELMAETTRRRIVDTMQAHPIGRRPLESYTSLCRGDRPETNDREEADEHEAHVPDPATPGEPHVGADPRGTGDPAPADDPAEPR